MKGQRRVFVKREMQVNVTEGQSVTSVTDCPSSLRNITLELKPKKKNRLSFEHPRVTSC